MLNINELFAPGVRVTVEHMSNLYVDDNESGLYEYCDICGADITLCAQYSYKGKWICGNCNEELLEDQ